MAQTISVCPLQSKYGLREILPLSEDTWSAPPVYSDGDGRLVSSSEKTASWSYLHLSHRLADMQAPPHTQTRAELTSDWQVCHEITNQKHLTSFGASNPPSRSDASR